LPIRCFPREGRRGRSEKGARKKSKKPLLFTLSRGGSTTGKGGDVSTHVREGLREKGFSRFTREFSLTIYDGKKMESREEGGDREIRKKNRVSSSIRGKKGTNLKVACDGDMSKEKKRPRLPPEKNARSLFGEGKKNKKRHPRKPSRREPKNSP